MIVPKFYRVYNTKYMKRAFIIIFALLLASAFVGVGTGFYLFNTPASTTKNEVEFEVLPGPFAATAKRLEEQGLVRSQMHLRVMARLTGYASRVRVGDYMLSPDMSPFQILQVVASGKSIQHILTVPEGSNIFEIAQQVEQLGISTGPKFISLCFNREFLKKHLSYEVVSCEGFLFPETYAYTKYTTPELLMAAMLEMFNDKFKPYAERAAEVGLTPVQLVTFASIVEKETGASDERKIVSSVYHNRLKIKMRMQADPTTLYGKMVKSKKLENNITRDDLKTLDQYNTYAMSGLPVGPIANPGVASLDAASSPVQSEYLFFVSQNDGRHVFSKDFKTHNAAVTSFQKKATARQGKSWRDLNKKSRRPKSARNR